MKKSKVIVISGMGGSGKSFYTEKLVAAYPDSKSLAFDDYDIDALPSAPPIDMPIEQAVNQYDIRRMVKDLRKEYGKYTYLFLDFPFGYKHEALKEWIDTVIYVQTPLDISFARRLLRDFQGQTGEVIQEMTESYLTFARPIFVDYERFIIEDVDLVIDGSLEAEQNMAIIREVI
ncbi:nucleoside/nucleotide kinase family protein [Enterococcus sp. LJL99]